MSVESFFKNGLLWLADPASQESATPPSPAARREVRLRFGLDDIDTQFPGTGLPTGTVHEWFSTQSTPPCSLFALAAGNILRQATEHHPQAPQKFIAWIGKDMWPTPYLLEQTMYVSMQEGGKSISKSLLSQCLFIDPPDEKLKLWAIELALRSPAVAVVVASSKKLRFAISRKFALAARASNALCFLFCDKKARTFPSAAFARWHIDPVALPSSGFGSSSPCFHLELLKCKGAQPRVSSWIVELREGICAYEHNQPTLSLHVPSAVGHYHGEISSQNVASSDHAASFIGRQKRQSAGR